MEQKYHTHQAQNFFTLTGLAVLVFIWFALALGVSGFFFVPIIAFGFSLMSTLVLFLLIKTLALLDIPEKIFLLILLGLALTSALPVEPTVFTGRDQGSIATAAIALAEHHAFRFSLPAADPFFSIYGPGLAYNFPGFFYTEHGELLTQFPLAYTAWLASFYALFRIDGLALGNGVLFAFSLFSFYFLLRNFLNRFIAFLGTLLMSAAFLPVWFVKFTLTENLALFLFIFLAFSVVRFRAEGKFLHYAAALSAAGIFCFTRIEGFLLLPITLLLIAESRHARSIWRLYPIKSLVAPIFLFLLTFGASFSDALPFYTMIGKALRDFLASFGGTEAAASAATASLPVLPILITYGLLLIAVLGSLGILIIFRYRKFSALIPFLIALPTFAYLLFPNITPDHPWMLRRYLPTIYPTLVFSTLVGISVLFSENRHFPIAFPESPRRRFILTLVFAGLFAFQTAAWHQGLLTRENANLLQETASIADFFGPRDLILVDRETTGSGFAMIAGPLASLHHKNAAYFFNPDDFHKIDRSLYAHVWLIVPTDTASQWAQSLSDYTLSVRHTIGFGSVSLNPIPTTDSNGTPHALSDGFSLESTPFGSAAVIFEIE